MIMKYANLTPKGNELLSLIEPELDNSWLRDVVDFEVNFIRRALEAEIAEKVNLIAEKDSLIAEKDSLIAEKDDEIARLKAKLAEKGLE